MRKNALVLVALAILGAAWPRFSGAAEKNVFLDAVEVKVASVEVVVEDQDGQKIPGLAAEDFEILEDGVAQEIDYFTAQENGQAVASLDPEAPEALPTTERVHLAIFVDDVHLSPKNRNEVFRRLKEYLATSLRPTDLVMVARLSDHLTIEQPFTNDVAALDRTLDRLAERTGVAFQQETAYKRLVGEISRVWTATDEEIAASRVQTKISPKESAAGYAREQAREIVAFSEERRTRVLGTIRALGTAIGSLAGLPGRKALIYLSDGLPVRPAVGLAEIWRDKYENWAVQNGLGNLVGELTRINTLSIEAEDQLRNMGTAASAARVAFYVLSPGGAAAQGFASTEMGGMSGGGTVRAASTEAFEVEAPLLQLAEMTGGRAATRSSDIGALLENIRSDFGTFYSLGYKPQKEAREGNRKIAVKVKGHPGASVRYTKTLGDPDPVDQLRELTLSALYHGLTENPLGIEVEPKTPEDLGGNKYRVDMLVKIPFEKLLLLPQEASHVGRLTLFVVVQDDQSQNLSGMRRVELPLDIPNDQILAVMAQKAAYPLKVEMKGGRQRMAIGIRDHLAKVSATVEMDLDVPDAMAGIPPAPPAPAAPAEGNSPVGGAD